MAGLKKHNVGRQQALEIFCGEEVWRQTTINQERWVRGLHIVSLNFVTHWAALHFVRLVQSMTGEFAYAPQVLWNRPLGAAFTPYWIASMETTNRLAVRQSPHDRLDGLTLSYHARSQSGVVIVYFTRSRR